MLLRMISLRKILSTLLIASTLTAWQPAMAWGRKGHATVAKIAEANLTPAARTQVQELLKGDLNNQGKLSGRTTLPDVASWADEIRKTAPPGTYKGWHVRSNSICRSALGPCSSGICGDQKLIHFIGVLKSRQASRRERNEALKFVVHLVGDMHMPLHSGSNHDNTGHFPVTLEDRQIRPNSTLHSLWDHELLALALRKPLNPVEIDTAPKLQANAVTLWMLEARELSRKHVYEPLPGFACGTPLPTPVKLSRAYEKQALPVIRKQVRRAGLRLAQVLNEALQ